MYPPDYDDGECTAAPGAMGNRSCHRYPGCGCGGGSRGSEDTEDRNAEREYQSWESQQNPEEWGTLRALHALCLLQYAIETYGPRHPETRKRLRKFLDLMK